MEKFLLEKKEHGVKRIGTVLLCLLLLLSFSACGLNQGKEADLSGLSPKDFAPDGGCYGVPGLSWGVDWQKAEKALDVDLLQGKETSGREIEGKSYYSVEIPCRLFDNPCRMSLDFCDDQLYLVRFFWEMETAEAAQAHFKSLAEEFKAAMGKHPREIGREDWADFGPVDYSWSKQGTSCNLTLYSLEMGDRADGVSLFLFDRKYGS